jgi:hypothetical protein
MEMVMVSGYNWKDMLKYIGISLILVCIAAVLAAGCTTEGPSAIPTPQIVYVTVIVTPTPIAGQDPIIGIWRISNSQGYDDRYRFNADGTYIESFYVVDSQTTQIYSGTWSAQGNNSYTKRDTITGVSKTIIYDPTKNAIYFTELSHILLTPYQGEIAQGIVFTTAISPTPTLKPTLDKNSIAYMNYKNDLREIEDINTELAILRSDYASEMQNAANRGDVARGRALTIEYNKQKAAYEIRLKAAQARAKTDLAEAGGET